MANELTTPCALIARLKSAGIEEQIAAALPRSVAAGLQWQLVVITRGDQFERADIGELSVRGGVPVCDLRQALDVALKACEPAGPANAYRALMPLRAVAKQRAEAEIDAKLAREVYARELAPYPSDIIAEAARLILRRSVWWPHPSELLHEIDNLMAPRRRLVRGLERVIRAAESGPLPAPEPETREQRLRSAIEILRRHGKEHMAAPREIELAELEGRAPAEWATRPKPPPTPPRREPRTLSEQDRRLAELAKEHRARFLARFDNEE
jgi:hypothetical protein